MRAFRFRARWPFVAAASLLVCFEATASENDVQGAYNAALRCYVANGHVYASFKKSGDLANTHLFEAKAKRAFDLAYSYGSTLHLSQQQVAADLDQTTNTELRKLLTDSGYLTIVAKDCKYWGMM